jgi:hypothetical protein
VPRRLEISEPVTFSGTTVVGIPGENGKEGPLAGVEVCVEDATGKAITAIPCAVTNAKGEYSFADLDPHQQLIMTFKKAGYGEQIIAADIGTADASRAPVRLVAGGGTAADAGAADAGAADAGAADAGGPPTFGWDPSVVMDSSKGMLNTFAVAQASSADAGTAAPGFDFLEGVSFAIAPKSGVGPFYMDANEKYVAGATSSSGGYGAWFLNVTPGTVTVTATSATYTCTAVAGNGYGWAQADGSAKAPIVAGLNTQSIGFFCTKK